MHRMLLSIAALVALIVVWGAPTASEAGAPCRAVTIGPGQTVRLRPGEGWISVSRLGDGCSVSTTARAVPRSALTSRGDVLRLARTIAGRTSAGAAAEPQQILNPPPYSRCQGAGTYFGRTDQCAWYLRSGDYSRTAVINLSLMSRSQANFWVGCPSLGYSSQAVFNDGSGNGSTGWGIAGCADGQLYTIQTDDGPLATGYSYDMTILVQPWPAGQFPPADAQGSMARSPATLRSTAAILDDLGNQLQFLELDQTWSWKHGKVSTVTHAAPYGGFSDPAGGAWVPSVAPPIVRSTGGAGASFSEKETTETYTNTSFPNASNFFDIQSTVRGDSSWSCWVQVTIAEWRAGWVVPRSCA
jgi:hypothetical protein